MNEAAGRHCSGCMTLDTLHRFLTAGFELVADERERGNARSYFWKRVDWTPASTTRVVRAYYDHHRTVIQIKLWISSDNNNSVFIYPPFDEERLHGAVSNEISLLLMRQ